MHLFIIEDDMDFSREMKDFLENSLYRVTCLTDFDRIAAQAVKLCPDLILLALNLPGTSGVEICTEIPRASDVTIIFVTGRTDSMDEVTALVKGGDDYVTKPFHPSLLAHITAVLKRTKRETSSSVMEHRGVDLDLSRGCARYHNADTDLCADPRTRNQLNSQHDGNRCPHPGAFQNAFCQICVTNLMEPKQGLPRQMAQINYGNTPRHCCRPARCPM